MTISSSSSSSLYSAPISLKILLTVLRCIGSIYSSPSKSWENSLLYSCLSSTHSDFFLLNFRVKSSFDCFFFFCVVVTNSSTSYSSSSSLSYSYFYSISLFLLSVSGSFYFYFFFFLFFLFFFLLSLLILYSFIFSLSLSFSMLFVHSLLLLSSKKSDVSDPNKSSLSSSN